MARIRMASLMAGLLVVSGCAMMHAGQRAQLPSSAPVTMPVVSLVFFHPWSAELTPVGRSIVDQTAAKIKETQPSTVTIAGYTYNDGTTDDNLRLANQRVDAVRKALIDDAVDPKLFLDIPIGPADDQAGKTGDRRIEIRLQYGH